VDRVVAVAATTHGVRDALLVPEVGLPGQHERHLGIGGLDAAETLGGVTDHSYRRQEAYAGVGGKLKRVSKEMADRGVAIDAERPPVGRTRRADHSEHDA